MSQVKTKVKTDNSLVQPLVRTNKSRLTSPKPSPKFLVKTNESNVMTLVKTKKSQVKPLVRTNRSQVKSKRSHYAPLTKLNDILIYYSNTPVNLQES